MKNTLLLILIPLLTAFSCSKYEVEELNNEQLSNTFYIEVGLTCAEVIINYSDLTSDSFTLCHGSEKIIDFKAGEVYINFDEPTLPMIHIYRYDIDGNVITLRKRKGSCKSLNYMLKI